MNETSAPARDGIWRALKWIALSGFSLGFAVGYWVLGCDGLLPLGARYCYPQRSHLLELLGCMEMEPDEVAATRLRARRFSLFGFPNIELQMEVSTTRLRELERRCGRFDGLDARGLGAEARPLGAGHHAITIRRPTGLRLH